MATIKFPDFIVSRHLNAFSDDFLLEEFSCMTSRALKIGEKNSLKVIIESSRSSHRVSQYLVNLFFFYLIVYFIHCGIQIVLTLRGTTKEFYYFFYSPKTVSN